MSRALCEQTARRRQQGTLNNRLQVSIKKQCLMLRKPSKYATKPLYPGDAVLHSAAHLAVLTRQAQSRVPAQHVQLCPC